MDDDSKIISEISKKLKMQGVIRSGLAFPRINHFRNDFSPQEKARFKELIEIWLVQGVLETNDSENSPLGTSTTPILTEAGADLFK